MSQKYESDHLECIAYAMPKAPYIKHVKNGMNIDILSFT